MKHETSYVFNSDITNVADVACMFRKLGWDDFTYHKYKMADGTEHQFINTYDGYVELPDLHAALAWIVSDISKLCTFVQEGYLVEEEAADATTD